MKDEATVLTAAKDKSNKDVEKRLTRLETLMRKIMSKAEIHWGVDVDLDGKIGSSSVKAFAVLASLFLCVSVIVAYSSDVIVDWASGQHASATAQILLESDGTALAKFNTVSNSVGKTYTSNLVVTAGGSVTLAGTTTQSGSITISGTDTHSGALNVTGTLTDNGTVMLLGGTNIFNIGGSTGILATTTINGTNVVYFK